MRPLICLLALAFSLTSCGGEPVDPVELGTVKWLRNYDTAVAKAKATNKPLLILFQEVPG